MARTTEHDDLLVFYPESRSIGDWVATIAPLTQSISIGLAQRNHHRPYPNSSKFRCAIATQHSSLNSTKPAI
jgi:hypothetical protein